VPKYLGIDWLFAEPQPRINKQIAEYLLHYEYSTSDFLIAGVSIFNEQASSNLIGSNLDPQK